VAVIENGVDTDYFASSCAARERRRRIVFVGSMSYHANVDAIIPFVRQAWPPIRERFPEWRLTIVGSNPVPAVLALGNEKHVEVAGTVPDVRPYYREALAAIVPLRVGGGTRLKILEAMAAGVPVVSTTLGAEGLAVTPDRNILIADTPADWLPRLQSLSDEGALWQRIAGAGLDLVRSRYDWEVLGDTLCATYSNWLHGGRA
jgi:glycosyltransferase involved in cell wall biosynthesis